MTRELFSNVWLVLCIAAVVCICGCKRTAPPAAPAPAAAAFVPRDPQLIAANNRGVGLMGKFQFEAARDIFAALLKDHPDWLDVKVNLAIATLNRQREGDEDAAMRLLVQTLQRDPSHVRGNYCAGLLRLYLGSPQDALPHFERVAAADADDSYAAYYVGQCLAQMDENARAAHWYQRAIELDGSLRSAYYAAAQAYRALGDDEKATQMRDQFQALEKNPRSRLVEFKYKRMGPKGEAVAVNLNPPPAPLPKPSGPIFADPVPLLTNGDEVQWTVRRDDRSVSITACDINGDGFIDVFIANVVDSDGIFNAVCINNGDDPPTFTLEKDHILASIPDVNAALWGDYDNDGLTDVYLCRRGPNMLWRQHKKNEWQDVTASTGTANEEFDSVDGAIFDADHDGDLDIFVVNFHGPNELFNNNLDGTFRAIGQEQGIAGSGTGSIQVVPADLDSDRDLDVVVVDKDLRQQIWINDRLWSYRLAPRLLWKRGTNEKASLLLVLAFRLVAADSNADGADDLFLLPSDNGPERVEWAKQPSTSYGSIPLLDYRGHGDQFDIAVADIDGGGAFERIDNLGSKLWIRRADKHDDILESIARERWAGWQLVTVDTVRGQSLIAQIQSRQPIIYRPGPGRHQFATLSFTGRREGDSMRSNASGIGTHIAARIGSMWVTGHTLKNSSGPGQSLQPIAIGLGGHSQIDFLSIDWSDGVFQSEIDLKTGEHHTIVETQRQLSSCPVLFAWNGNEFAFISDVLGVGGMGYLTAPHEYAEPRPWENFMLPLGVLHPRNGRFMLKLSEPMEEACYLDAARLIVYDLPPGWQMTLDERMNIAGPPPTGEARFYWDELQPNHAINDRDEDVAELILSLDGRAAPVGELDHRFIGRLKGDHQLTLTFDVPLNPTDHVLSGTPLLVIDGWVEYPYSQTMFAAWQANAEYRAPTLEARSDAGEWQIVLEQFGYPAGMPRQMSVPLQNLPPDTVQLRITTNQEVYFDRITIAYAEPMPSQAIRRELPLLDSRLMKTGFALRTTGAQRQPYYDYDQRSPFWDTRYQPGEYTRLGEVTELLQSTDDALAIFGPGEEVHMEFDANLPPVPYTLAATESGVAGQWTRVFVLELNGWCKDMDLFTKDGETIAPVPSVSNDPEQIRRREELHRRYNTRYEGWR